MAPDNEDPSSSEVVGAGQPQLIPQLTQLLVTVRPRERSGSRMTNRVEYQKHWVLSEMLVLHIAAEDYCFVFEHHDDVLLLDSPVAPTRASFYQVKTKASGKWTLSQLLKRDRTDEGVGFSILGKLYLHKTNFGSSAAALTFVSNVPCSVRLGAASGEAGDVERACASQLHGDEQTTLLAKLRDEHGDTVAVGDVNLFFLVHSDLALRNTEDHGVGKLERFLSIQFPLRKLHVRAIYHALLGEISRRTGHEDIPTSFEQLVNERGLSRNAVDQILSRAGVHDDPDGALQVMRGLLAQLGWGPGRLQNFVAKWRQYEIERMNPEHTTLSRLRTRVNSAVVPFVRTDEAPLAAILADVTGNSEVKAMAAANLLGKDYLEAMTLFEYMEAYEKHYSSPDSAASEEAA